MASEPKLISLSKGKAFTIVDAEDYEYLSQWRWKLNHGRAMRNQHIGTVGHWRDGKRKDKAVLMHRVIMGEPEGMDVDHENGNSLDNRRSNLRVCTHAENRANSKLYSNNKSGFKGVHSAPQGWYVSFRFLGRTYNFYGYVTPEEAALEYDNIARQLFGKYARPNFGDNR